VTAFGGYLDIIVDFTVYSLIPISVTAKSNNYASWYSYIIRLRQYRIALSFLEAAFFVNAASLFYLSALIEKNEFAKVT
jgi:phosphatidylglycerophosphate synthase